MLLRGKYGDKCTHTGNTQASPHVVTLTALAALREEQEGGGGCKVASDGKYFTL